MEHPVELLLETAIADSQLLFHNRESGDDYLKPRDIDFVFYTDDKKRAKTVASFITDNRYGEPSVEKTEDEDGRRIFRLVVVANVPATDEVVHSMSALMCMLSQLFGIEYDGWGCVLQKTQRNSPPPLPPALPQ